LGHESQMFFIALSHEKGILKRESKGEDWMVSVTRFTQIEFK